MRVKYLEMFTFMGYKEGIFSKRKLSKSKTPLEHVFNAL
jgi:hypothetical protein